MKNKNKYATFLVAVLAAKKGFKKDCTHYYDSNRKLIETINHCSCDEDYLIMNECVCGADESEIESSESVQAPLLHDVADWLREKGIEVTVLPLKDNGPIYYNFSVIVTAEYSELDFEDYSNNMHNVENIDYYNALDLGVKEGLIHLKDK